MLHMKLGVLVQLSLMLSINLIVSTCKMNVDLSLRPTCLVFVFITHTVAIKQKCPVSNVKTQRRHWPVFLETANLLMQVKQLS